jgi:leukotriene-A4 hydrolase
MVDNPTSAPLELPVDPTTQSNYLEIVTESVEFYWTVDFHDKIIKGSATHSLRVISQQISEVV